MLIRIAINNINAVQPCAPAGGGKSRRFPPMKKKLQCKGLFSPCGGRAFFCLAPPPPPLTKIYAGAHG